jgi:hypothetical protein
LSRQFGETGHLPFFPAFFGLVLVANFIAALAPALGAFLFFGQAGGQFGPLHLSQDWAAIPAGGSAGSVQ